jgi:hypothetical protein
MMPERSYTGVPVAGHSLDLPEVTAFSSRFDAVIGAGWGKLERDGAILVVGVARGAGRTKRVASLASHPVPPSRENFTAISGR